MMIFRDDMEDLLSVYAYIRDQGSTLDAAITGNLDQLEENDAALDRCEDDMKEIFALLQELGAPEETLAEITAPRTFAFQPMAPVKIPVSRDEDWQAKFDEYVAKAAQKGYVNVKLEELLTPEEIASAAARNQKLDQLFSAATALNGRDMLVVSIGVLLHVLRHFAFKQQLDKASAEQSDSGACIPEEAEIDGSWLPSRPGQVPPENGSVPAESSMQKIQRVLSYLPIPRRIEIKSADRILLDTPSFQQVSDDRYRDASAFLGNHMLWGWVVGVFNIMTDTVTTRNMHTFQPMVSQDLSHFTLSQEHLPFYDLFIPFADQGLAGMEDQLVASMLREAYVLLPNRSDFSNVQALFQQNKEAMALSSSALSQLDGAAPLLGVSQTLKNTGWSNLINILLIAAHNLFYRKEEDPKQYMVRTMKVITLANAIGTFAVSAPALLAKDFKGVDFAGAITSVQNVAGLTKVMIDAKTEFLVSETLPDMQSRLRALNSYFEDEPTV